MRKTNLGVTPEWRLVKARLGSFRAQPRGRVSSWGSVGQGRTPPQASTEVAPSALKTQRTPWCQLKKQDASELLRDLLHRIERAELTEEQTRYVILGSKRQQTSTENSPPG
jgi:hypothetical protein